MIMKRLRNIVDYWKVIPEERKDEIQRVVGLVFFFTVYVVFIALTFPEVQNFIFN